MAQRARPARYVYCKCAGAARSPAKVSVRPTHLITRRYPAGTPALASREPRRPRGSRSRSSRTRPQHHRCPARPPAGSTRRLAHHRRACRRGGAVWSRWCRRAPTPARESLIGAAVALLSRPVAAVPRTAPARRDITERHDQVAGAAERHTDFVGDLQRMRRLEARRVLQCGGGLWAAGQARLRPRRGCGEPGDVRVPGRSRHHALAPEIMSSRPRSF